MAVLSRVRRYVPEYGDNDTKTAGEQIVCYLKSVDVYTRQAHIRKFLSKKAEEITQMMMEDKGSKEIKDILLNNVVRFENLTLEDVDASGAATSRVATMQDVWDMGEFGLCMELFSNILNHSQLGKEEAKNSASQSGSTPESPDSQPQVH